MSVVLPAELAERVQLLADVRGERLTTTVVRLIETGERQAHEDIREDALSVLRTELLEMVGQMGSQVRKEVQGQAHRLSHLLVRTALESMATRQTSGHALLKVSGDDLEAAQKLVDGSWNQAVQRLKNPSPGVRETLNLLVEGAGTQDPTTLVSLAEAVQDLQQGLGAITALAGRVKVLESQGTAAQGSVGELTTQVQLMTGAVSEAVANLKKAEQEFLNRPKSYLQIGRQS